MSSFRPQRRRQAGIALITSLLILVVVTLLAVSMYRSFGLQEKIAGNTLEKQRSLQAAESALQYGEWWLSLGAGGTGSACGAATLNANTLTNMKVCNTALAKPTTLPWSTTLEYTPPSMSVVAGGGLNGTTLDVNYQKKPGLYISYLGLGPDGKSMLYQVTGAGYGGSDSTKTVVQSTFAMGFRIKDLSGP